MNVAEHGVWRQGGADMKGEVVSDALLKVFSPRRWAFVGPMDELKWRLQKGDVAMFHTAHVLNTIGEMCNKLKFDAAVVPLDSRHCVEKVEKLPWSLLHRLLDAGANLGLGR